jgi:hypothetical protein
MRIIKSTILFSIMLALVSSTAAWAGRGHGHSYGHSRSHVGVYIAAPLFFGAGYYAARPYYPVSPYYPAPMYYYESPPIYAMPSAPTYIERGSAQPAGQDQVGDWYYCNNPQGYYPNVAQCPSGWQRVSSQR